MKKNTEYTSEEIVAKIKSGEWLLSASIGMGRDSVSFTPEFKRLGIPVAQYIFANTGNEKHATYRYKDEVFRPWLRANVGMDLTEVKYSDRAQHGRYNTIVENCIANLTLPSLAFGGSCSHSNKFKHAVMDYFRAKEWQLGMDCINAGGKIVCAIGYDNSDKDLKRRRRMDNYVPNALKRLAKLEAELADATPENAKKIAAKIRAKQKTIDHIESGPFVCWYPLQDWKWDRERLTREIEKAGLPVPPKSSCVICPAMQPAELDWTAVWERDLFLEALKVERLYRETMELSEDGMSGVYHKNGKPTKVVGLWGQSGRKVEDRKFKSWNEYADWRGLLDPKRLQEIIDSGMYNNYPDVETPMDFTCEGPDEDAEEEAAG